MNDLAEKALDGLIAARRAVAARPVPVLAVTGFAVAAAIVVTGARLGAAPAAVPINRWLGLLPEAGYRITGVAMGLTMLGAIVALLVTWIVTFVVAVRAQFTERQLWTLAASWAVPFVIGPPLLSTDVFADVARGLLSRAGLSPYTTAPSHLGELRIVDAIDPDLARHRQQRRPAEHTAGAPGGDTVRRRGRPGAARVPTHSAGQRDRRRPVRE